jgi:Flp pilus assembly pilin Flp
MRVFSLKLLRDDQGQDLIEYALLAGCVALLTIGALQAVGVSLNMWWTDISGEIEGWTP